MVTTFIISLLSLIVIYCFITGSNQETMLAKDSNKTFEFSHFPKLCMLGKFIRWFFILLYF